MTISVKISKDRLKYLKKMSHSLSLDRDEDLSVSDLVREALDQTYPMPVSAKKIEDD
tara:strand:- start:4610 stop:4780 length:171 start_codon:yes stop_codon:yes gene_type:complete